LLNAFWDRHRTGKESALRRPEIFWNDRAHQDFLALWKDADPDIPILKEAKAEYAKLQ
jgi:hypothetical protein